MSNWADIFQINVNSYENLVLQGTVSTELLQGHFEHIYLPNPITIIGDENVSFKLSSHNISLHSLLTVRWRWCTELCTILRYMGPATLLQLDHFNTFPWQARPIKDS